MTPTWLWTEKATRKGVVSDPIEPRQGIINDSYPAVVSERVRVDVNADAREISSACRLAVVDRDIARRNGARNILVDKRHIAVSTSGCGTHKMKLENDKNDNKYKKKV